MGGHTAAIEHDFVPILSGRDGEQQEEGVEEVIEIFKVVQYFSLLHVAKHEHSKDRKHKKDEHEEHKHVEEYGDGKHDCLDDGLQPLCFSC
jgi:hypothetical protein